MFEKNISILGSTGSIGTQTLEIVENNPDKYNVVALTTNSNIDTLINQAKKFHPNLLVVNDSSLKDELWNKLKEENLNNIKIASGQEGMIQAGEMAEAELVVVSVVGFSGVIPTISALKADKDVALANKETLVAAGEQVMRLSHQSKGRLLPIDSEHSAIFQALMGEKNDSVNKLILTASGGPFFGKTKEELYNISPKDALKHPNWDMGNKISIDSATLMNKGLEVIEAHWLFNIPFEQIDVVIHPQSIVHSLVEFVDGAMKAELGLPDMRIPIQFALGYPQREANNFERLDLTDFDLTFKKPDTKTFPCLSLAYQAGKIGGSMPCVLNAANEQAVYQFLAKKITFLQIPELIEKVMEKHEVIKNPSIENLISVDNWARKATDENIT
ncbi:1-deoxy-D-xylulose-5-phosphate reductoisomerase [Natranaerobius thermophilus]|uniref:1-deoxy-D-xylulose 5-phosphate reductoisomerase n=1 Tax=Natranaerobius thermophilus (strain ATCC BAA-1301 / DSM 18059 / JW/NM-WN-LF) TaxID=457570 RepID=B2A388_NATTJ|nr:1-deoxy-D-xylulose-5-phosphate reductoisomerase [Natranaerobius thermophilus]ACB85018.1 1-deoxy-D-xylulose 5-phosphate reductoisomerase [Natranaerobius thermophilus JW/NM-WN-LF]